jgi:hypothetical protein
MLIITKYSTHEANSYRTLGRNISMTVVDLNSLLLVIDRSNCKNAARI